MHLLRMTDESELRQRMGEAGRERAREHFDARDMARAVEQLYMRLQS
jgi:glycosyltransferase involved in cell wall biosynthesis